MALVNIAEELYKSFLEKGADSRVILLHADGRYRPVLLSKLLASPELKVYYYAMGPDDIDVVAFLSGFTHDMAEQVPNFGGRINHLGFNTDDGLDALVDAMAADLNDLNDAPFLLVLDEFDQADIADDLQAFIEKLIDRLPPQCKLVLSSRQLPRLPWVSMIAQNKAIMLRDSELVSNHFYQKPFEGEARIQVHGLGPGHVVLDGDTVNTWEGHLPRLLFFFCLDRPMVTRSGPNWTTIRR
jgi:ATP/maltotriose-dependent transcriptional regulator MalT